MSFPLIQSSSDLSYWNTFLTDLPAFSISSLQFILHTWSNNFPNVYVWPHHFLVQKLWVVFLPLCVPVGCYSGTSFLYNPSHYNLLPSSSGFSATFFRNLGLISQFQCNPFLLILRASFLDSFFDVISSYFVSYLYMHRHLSSNARTMLLSIFISCLKQNALHIVDNLQIIVQLLILLKSLELGLYKNLSITPLEILTVPKHLFS